ncbi:MAG: nucleotidyl transferase AbiEii/AbiGii toxin family protein [Chlamydiae bacterium]|nr:nucleotidyl transferase AbiEii/AbiGii toxin family protein [Chlamydiota bacterium]
MKLFEHPDFEQAIIRAAEYFNSSGMRESIIEKDYFVTEVLRIISQTSGDKVIFKGGTSLSKGWNLIQRFSEDVDIFFDPKAFDPHLGKNAINRELKKLRQAIEKYPGLKFIEGESQTIGGFGRSDCFEYAQRLSEVGDIRNRVLVEIGTASGREPIESLRLQSYLGRFLQEKGISLGADDESSFEMKLLHFRRTFVEKMFAIHAKVELFKKTGLGIGGYARHYYDLFYLAKRLEVVQMLQSYEYEEIKNDYDKISSEYFSASYIPPNEMDFQKSDALFPSPQLASILGQEFEKQCRLLCFGEYPTWSQVQQMFNEIKELL